MNCFETTRLLLCYRTLVRLAASGISDHIGAKAPCVCLSTASRSPKAAVFASLGIYKLRYLFAIFLASIPFTRSLVLWLSVGVMSMVWSGVLAFVCCVRGALFHVGCW